MSFLDGYKTYIIAGVGLLYAGTQLWGGSITINEFITAALVSLAAMGLKRDQAAEVKKIAEK